MQITDLKPLTGMPLKELPRVNTKVADVAPLLGMQATLRKFALNKTKVTDAQFWGALPKCEILKENRE